MIWRIDPAALQVQHPPPAAPHARPQSGNHVCVKIRGWRRGRKRGGRERERAAPAGMMTETAVLCILTSLSHPFPFNAHEAPFGCHALTDPAGLPPKSQVTTAGYALQHAAIRTRRGWGFKAEAEGEQEKEEKRITVPFSWPVSTCPPDACATHRTGLGTLQAEVLVNSLSSHEGRSQHKSMHTVACVTAVETARDRCEIEATQGKGWSIRYRFGARSDRRHALNTSQNTSEIEFGEVFCETDL